MYNYTTYDYGYDYGYEAAEAATGLAAFGVGFLIFWLIGMAIGVFTIVCNWKVFTKAGKPGWASIIPIYNTIVMIEIAGLPLWYIALFFIPFANIYAMFKIYIEIAHKFGKSTGFGVGMVFFTPIFMAILAFDKTTNYAGAQGTQVMSQQPVQPMQQPVASQPVQPMQQPVASQPVQPMQQPVASQSVQPMQQPEVSQSGSSQFCTNCGNSLAPNTKFCTNCGKQI